MVIHVPLKNDGWKTIITIVFLKWSLFRGDIPSFSGIPSPRDLRDHPACTTGRGAWRGLPMSIGCKMWMWHSPSTHVETPTVGTRGPCFIIFLHFFCWAQNPPAPKTGCLWVWGVFTISFLEPPLNSRLGDSDPDPRTHEFETSPHLRGWYLDSVDGWTWRKNIWDLNTRSNDEAPHGNNILSIKKSN